MQSTESCRARSELPLCNPPPNVIWSRWPRHVLLMIGHLQVLNVININIMIVIATIAMIGQLQLGASKTLPSSWRLLPTTTFCR